MTSNILSRLATEQKKVANIVGVPGVPDLYQTSAFQYSPPWVNPPDNFISFDKFGVIPTPALGTGDNVVLSFLVPVGQDGVIRGLSHNYSAGGFNQGSGDIIWRLMVDGRAVRNYDNMMVEFGSVQSPRSNWGIRIYQGQLITYVVNLPAGTGFIVSIPSQIVCSINGWLYPRAVA